jgi:hypothetical protein
MTILVAEGANTALAPPRGGGGPPVGISCVQVCPVGARIVKVKGAEVSTVTLTVPGVATCAIETDAVSCVALTKVVDKAEVPH